MAKQRQQLGKIGSENLRRIDVPPLKTQGDLTPKPLADPPPISIRETINTFVGYSNTVQIRTTPEEVFLYFLEKMGDDNQANGLARIYLSLGHAKRLAKELNDSLAKYEKLFGTIPIEPVFSEEGRKFIEEQQKEVKVSHASNKSASK